MPVPSYITDLSQTASSNFPQGSDSPSLLDDVQRAHGSFIARLRDGVGFTNPVTLASAGTVDIGGQNSLSVEISGTTAITSFGVNYNGPRFLRFTGILSLTQSTALNLPTGANITTAAGDTCIAVPNYGASGWNVVSYTRAAGQPILDQNQAAESSIASAATVAIGAASSANILITGTTAITAFDSVQAGIVRHVRFSGSLTLTYNATSLILPGSASIVTAANDCAEFESLGSGNWICRSYQPASGIALASTQLQSIAASVASNALTITSVSTKLDFRSATLANGSPIYGFPVPALTLTVPSGATLGTVASQSARLHVLVAYNAGSPVLCICNGLSIDESSLISPVTISTGATSIGTIYSASTVASNSPWRLIGYIDISEATAGTWATAPTEVQGWGGSLSFGSFGIGQSWQLVTPSRAKGTYYYNTSGKPRSVSIGGNAGAAGGILVLQVNGVTVAQSSSYSAASGTIFLTGIVPPGNNYVVVDGSGTNSINQWSELG